MRPPRPIFTLLLLLAGVFTLATALQVRASRWAVRSRTDSVLQLLLGDSRRLFANHFFVKADVYFHSGYYPTIFDQARRSREEGTKHMAVAQDEHDEHEDHDAHAEQDEDEHERQMALGAPKDWIERFSRRFQITDHTHLEGENAREILPWLRISAELDPQQVETYRVAAYWLRRRLGKVDEAEQFLREGLRANPNSYEILLELGRLYEEDRHDVQRARNIWHLALRRWQERELNQEQPDFVAFDAITVSLAHLEKEEGNTAEAIKWFELAKPHAPNPAAIQKQIDELRLKLGPAAPVQ